MWLILGAGLTGISAAKYLAKLDNKVILYEDKQNNKLQSILTEGNKKNIKIVHNIENINWQEIEKFLPSPGIPHTHPVFIKAKTNCIPIISDIDIFYSQTKNALHIAITGTNGKSTTCALLDHILKHCNIKSTLGGNIGIPVLDLPIEGYDCYVLELSSFQLELLEHSNFRIAVLSNITSDHLDRYNSIEEYINAKEQIFARQSKEDFAIISVDNNYTHSIYQKYSSLNKQTVIPLSTKVLLDYGISMIDETLYIKIPQLNINVEKRFAIPLSLGGKHNWENVAISTFIAYFLMLSKNKADLIAIAESLLSFKGLDHRNQIVHQTPNILFINDSKATNTGAALQSISIYDNILLIAGGVKKDNDFHMISQFKDKIKKVFLIGACAEEYREILNNLGITNELTSTLQNTMEKIYAYINTNIIPEKYTVLLAPAAASLDQFANYSERGKVFVSLVKENK